jgi:hypothetical protein
MQSLQRYSFSIQYAIGSNAVWRSLCTDSDYGILCLLNKAMGLTVDVTG